ncbi:MAG TPA: LacI family DNA-binding transcriptional regulator [Gaiellaceae bacterium]|nr:LacI family DNA-binding transcriptional regulator [Gaiellaceae bacterium]
MREVAALAGVSPATVSRVLSGAAAVRADHRRRVLDAVRQTGYRPNRIAQNLRRQRAETIGVVVPDIANPHFNEAVSVIEQLAFSEGYRLFLCSTDETVVKQRAYLQALADERALGVIVAPADSRGSGLARLFELGIPVVVFDRWVHDERADAVLCDNMDATRKATEHLLWLGHERIAYVGGRLDLETGAERLEGYTATMRAAGRTPFAVDGGFRTDLAERETGALLAVREPPTALVVGNNVMTLGALHAIRAAGVRVPDELALVAIDDPSWAALVDPPLTVVAQPVQKMAETAMTLLLERLHGGRGDSVRSVLPLELRIRQSCGMKARAG